LGAPFYWALEEGRRVTAALACPTEVDGIAWVRLFVYSMGWSPQNAWSLLWATARDEIAKTGGATVAAIAMQPWFQQVLTASGFDNRQNIVMLEWQYQRWAARESQDIQIRRMNHTDLPEVMKADHAAFHPLWHNSLDTIERAYAQALHATVAVGSDGIVGYQLTTGHRQRAHLARLAVDPAVQGRGIGQILLSDLFTRLTQSGISHLSVNTQSDNRVSLALYQKMGFQRTGEQYPVYTFDVSANL
jgi:ribosomal-protein-alanine N-acetyltransferase